MSAGLEFLREMAHELVTQDNAYTSMPIPTVQVQHLVTGIDTDYTERIGWLDTDTGSLVDEDAAARLESKYQKDFTEPDGYVRTGYQWEWRHLQTFITTKAAEAFIERNRHNYRDGTRTYIDSACRNPEMAEVRRLLSGPVLACVEALLATTAELKKMHGKSAPFCEGECPTGTTIKQAEAALDLLDTFKDPYR
jgi:hypothetical protein